MRASQFAIRLVAASALLATVLSAQLASDATAAAAATPTTITVGSLPIGVRVAPGGAKAYVANFISNSVSVINTATGTIVATIPVGGGTNPFGVAIAPNGARVYVTKNSAASVGVIDSATNSVVASIPVGQSPRHLAISPDSAWVT